MRQIVVISENRIGVIAEISRVLSERGVNIERLDTSRTETHGAVVLTADDYDAALRALNGAGFKAVSEDAVVVRLKNEPGSLAKLSGRLSGANIDIRGMHIISRDGGHSLVAVSTADNARVRALLKDEDGTVVG